MKLNKEYTYKIALLIFGLVILLEIIVCFLIYFNSYNIYEKILFNTFESSRRKTTQFTQSVNLYIGNVLVKFINYLKLITKHTFIFNGKKNSNKIDSINKNSKIFFNNNLQNKILPAKTEEIIKIKNFRNIYNSKTGTFDYLNDYKEKYAKENNNDIILNKLLKEHDELNSISYHNNTGETNIEYLDEETKQKLLFIIPIFKSIFIQRFIEKKSLMDIIRIYILNKKEFIIYPPEDSYRVNLYYFQFLYPTNCDPLENHYLCIYNFIFNYLFMNMDLELLFEEYFEYENHIGSICMKFPFYKEKPDESILCIEINYVEIVKIINIHNAYNFDFGLFTPLILNDIKDLFIMANGYGNASKEFHKVFNNTKVTPYEFVIDENKLIKYYSLYHYMYLDTTKTIIEHPELNVDISKIKEEYETIILKVLEICNKVTNNTKFIFNKTTCRKEILGNDYECFTDEAEINIIPLEMRLNKLNEDFVETNNISIADHKLFIYSIIYINPKINRIVIGAILKYKIIRIIFFYLLMTLVIICCFILFINRVSIHSFSYIDNIINYLNKIKVNENQKTLNISEENKNKIPNKEMIILNDIYELIRKSLIIKESFNNGIYSNNLENELYKISQEINDKKTKEICNSLLGITHLKNNRYSLSENELHSIINYIQEHEIKLNIKEEYDKIKDTIKRSSNLIYLNEYSNFDSIDERMLEIIHLNIYKQRFIFYYAMTQFQYGIKINIIKNEKDKEKRKKYFNDAIKYFKECININDLLGINLIKKIYSLNMVTKCYLYMQDYKNSIITINEALSLYFYFSKLFTEYHSLVYNPKIMIFIESNIYHNIIYTLSLICLKFNKPCAFCYLTLKIFETSPFILNNIHKNAAINLLNYLEKNKYKMNKFIYRNKNLMKLSDKNIKLFTKIISRLQFKNLDVENKNINFKEQSESKYSSNNKNKTFKETIMDKSNKSSTLKGAFTSKLSNYYHSKRVYKNITICLSEKILGIINGEELKNIIINYLEKFYSKNENDKFSFIQYALNGKKTVFFQPCSSNEFIAKFHKSKSTFQSSDDLLNKQKKSTLFMGLYDLFDLAIRNCQNNELSDNIIMLFIASEDIRFSSIVDCMNIVEELNKNNVSVYFFCYDEIIDENKINNIQSFLNGLIDGYFFQIKNYQQIKEVFINLSNMNYQSNFFKFDYYCFDNYL